MSEIIELKINTNKAYAITFDAFGEDDEIHLSGESFNNIVRDLTIPKQDVGKMIQHELRILQSAINRAIEDGDSLKIGIVVGQIASKLDGLTKL